MDPLVLPAALLADRKASAMLSARTRSVSSKAGRHPPPSCPPSH